MADFSPCQAHFGPLLGAKILQSMTISSLAPISILWLWDWPKNQAYLAILMGFIDFLPLVVIFGHFQPFLAVFGPPWALGFLEHLHKEPDVYIYPLSMAPAKKNLQFWIHFIFIYFFVKWLLVVNFSPGWAHFGSLLGAKILQSKTISNLAPNSILWLWD